VRSEVTGIVNFYLTVLVTIFFSLMNFDLFSEMTVLYKTFFGLMVIIFVYSYGRFFGLRGCTFSDQVLPNGLIMPDFRDLARVTKGNAASCGSVFLQ